MKNKLLYPVILILGMVLVTTSKNQVYCQTTQKKSEMKQTVNYTCPEHPDIVQDKPGTCPKCGMQLVAMNSMSQMHDSTMMKKDNKKMKQEPSKMKNGNMKNGERMKHDHMKMKNDSIKMKKKGM